MLINLAAGKHTVSVYVAKGTIESWPGTVLETCSSALVAQEQEGQDIKVILDYTESSRLAWVT